MLAGRLLGMVAEAAPLLTQIAHTSEAYNAGPNRWHVSVTRRSAGIPITVEPRTPARDSVDSLLRAHWIADLTPRIVDFIEPIGNPLPHIAQRVIETAGVRLLALSIVCFALRIIVVPSDLIQVAVA